MTQEPLLDKPLDPGEISQPPEPAPKKKRTLLWAIIGAAAILILGGAAFLAGRLFNNRAATSQNGPIVSTGPNGQQSVRISPGDFGPWPTEIPQADPDVTGLFVSRDDNLLTLGTGNARIASTVNQSGTATVNSSYDGPKVEVLVTGQTKIYRDTTMDDLTNSIPHDGEKIQRKVAAGSLDEITADSSITVWGRKSGDRYTADVLIYSSPLMLAKPASK